MEHDLVEDRRAVINVIGVVFSFGMVVPVAWILGSAASGIWTWYVLILFALGIVFVFSGHPRIEIEVRTNGFTTTLNP